ncbi:leucine-rich repeat-containing protein 34 isoform X2 [Nycticebus coucang]|uniref:leucine-rich repeat-containing protein 34 isoform X2 n=1 Tax=Nycticebus coucang TaxID=9470 RepID=UPI00234D9B62|nr:leucine-rich repeat-containing protein 34 isoform X2 [Nycticebus coucang]
MRRGGEDAAAALAGSASSAPGSMGTISPDPGRTAAESFAGLQGDYQNLCLDRSQRVNPFILLKLQEADEEVTKGQAEGITLNIAGNNHLVPVERVTGEDFWILSRVLMNCQYINGLDIRYNLLSDVGAYYAAKMLQKQLNLVYLNLMFNDIGPEGGEMIAKALHKNKTLKYLRMTGNKIENKGGMCFAAMLQINSSLQKLDLGDCDLEESTVHLGHMLKENHFLVELHLCKHGIKSFGMQQLCDALRLNSALRYLDVSCNQITRDGMMYLANVLKSNTTLEVIDLSFNRIENVGATYLSETLTSHNRSLKALSVVSNNIQGEGLVALSQAMRTNPVISNIYIWGNKFDEATCVAYSELIQMGRLKPEDTDVEPFTVDGHVHLAEVSHGLKKHYYWTPSHGEAHGHSANAGFALIPVGPHI